MHLTIDASNIKDEGGGLTHLSQLIKYYKNIDNTKITLFSSKRTLNKISNYDYLTKKNINSIVISNFFLRFVWQILSFNKKKLNKSDILIVLGGIYFGNFKPTVVLCQNLLPFSKNQYSKYSFLNKIKLSLQSYLYTKSFNKSSGVVYITDSSRKIIIKNKFKINTKYKIIMHGNDFKKEKIKKIKKFDEKNSFKLLYVSRFQPYKNHFILLDCFNELLELGYNLKLILVFSEDNYLLKKIKNELNFKKNKNNIIIKNNLNQQELSNEYFNADCFVYPSDCETFGMPLVEAASHSLPIACTDYNVFREILDNSGDYFNLEDKNHIKKTIIKFYEDIDYLTYKSNLVYKKSKEYNWEKSMKKYHHYICEIIYNEKK